MLLSGIWQLSITQDYCSIKRQVLKEQLTAINFKQNQQYRRKIDI